MGPSLLLRRLLAASLALAWAFVAVESGVHALEAIHVVCDEHGVVEHLGDGEADRDEAHIEAPPASSDAAHDACGELLAIQDESSSLTPALVALPQPPPSLDGDVTVLAPTWDSTQPRGPPLLAYAAKTSPPRA